MRVKTLIEAATNDRNFHIDDLRDYAKFLNEDRGGDSSSEKKENNKNFISKNNKNNANIGQINDRLNKSNRNIERFFFQDA